MRRGTGRGQAGFRPWAGADCESAVFRHTWSAGTDEDAMIRSILLGAFSALLLSGAALATASLLSPAPRGRGKWFVRFGYGRRASSGSSRGGTARRRRQRYLPDASDADAPS